MTALEEQAWDLGYKAVSFIRMASKVTEEKEYLLLMDEAYRSALHLGDSIRAAMSVRTAASALISRETEDKHGRV